MNEAEMMLVKQFGPKLARRVQELAQAHSPDNLIDAQWSLWMSDMLSGGSKWADEIEFFDLVELAIRTGIDLQQLLLDL